MFLIFNSVFYVGIHAIISLLEFNNGNGAVVLVFFSLMWAISASLIPHFVFSCHSQLTCGFRMVFSLFPPRILSHSLLCGFPLLLSVSLQAALSFWETQKEKKLLWLLEFLSALFVCFSFCILYMAWNRALHLGVRNKCWFIVNWS